MQTDIFVFHGYTEFYLGNKWVKATPAFNLSLCEKSGIKPLEFNGKTDSIFHEYDTKGNHHMEYLRDRGHFSDFPYDNMIDAWKAAYPQFSLELLDVIEGSFDEDVALEKKE